MSFQHCGNSFSSAHCYFNKTTAPWFSKSDMEQLDLTRPQPINTYRMNWNKPRRPTSVCDVTGALLADGALLEQQLNCYSFKDYAWPCISQSVLFSVSVVIFLRTNCATQVLYKVHFKCQCLVWQRRSGVSEGFATSCP